MIESLAILGAKLIEYVFKDNKLTLLFSLIVGFSLKVFMELSIESCILSSLVTYFLVLISCKMIYRIVEKVNKVKESKREDEKKYKDYMEGLKINISVQTEEIQSLLNELVENNNVGVIIDKIPLWLISQGRAYQNKTSSNSKYGEAGLIVYEIIEYNKQKDLILPYKVKIRIKNEYFLWVKEIKKEVKDFTRMIHIS